MPSIFANEIEPFAAEWLANLGKETHIDTRSIAQVAPADVAGFRRVHFFAGIGGWELALQLAGWPEDEEVWTGSCPCQPFSVAGKRGGTADERHLWPEFFRLIKECRPATIFGEQVASKNGLGWLDGVFADLEGAGYACGAADLCAAGIGAPHIRQRLFWVAYAADSRHPRAGQGAASHRDGADSLPQRRHAFDESAGSGEVDRMANAGRRNDGRKGREEPTRRSIAGGTAHRLEHAPSDGREQGRAESERGSVASGCGVGGLGDSEGDRQEGRSAIAAGAPDRPMPPSAWDDFSIIPCRDGKSRRISAERGDEPLAYGIPLKAGHIVARLGELGFDSKAAKRIIANARRNRTGRLRGYGNAIVPQVAVEFIKTILESSFRT
jgi:DNA (cytosine-5)-methyltransferase 1